MCRQCRSTGLEGHLHHVTCTRNGCAEKRLMEQPGEQSSELALGRVGGILAARRWQGLYGAGPWVHKVAGHHAAEPAAHHLQQYSTDSPHMHKGARTGKGKE